MADVELHCVEEGAADAPVVVMSPSLGTDLSMWAAQAALLARRRRVIRIDLRGHGASPAPHGPYAIAELGGDVLALLDRLGIARAALCGLSIGGMLSMWIAASAPERVERLAVCCTSARIDPDNNYLQRAEAVRAHGIEPIADTVLSRWISPGFAERHPDLRDDLRARLVATPAEGYAGCCEALAQMDLRDEIPAIHAPTLVIAGAQDAATPPDHGHAIAAAIVGARFEVVEGAMHLANVEQPEAIGRLLEAFLTAETD